MNLTPSHLGSTITYKMAKIGQLNKIHQLYFPANFFASTLEGQFASKSLFLSCIIGSILCVHLY